ncbi:MAG: NAD(P)/FAD-dependent oxidoreductase, partial [Bacteroidota bacterium]
MKKSLAAGASLPFLSVMLSACGNKEIILPEIDTNFQGKVVVIGAGSAGMTAAYLLKRYGVDFELLEAADDFGGRVKRLSGFADFPIDLGAEWIHTDPEVFARMASDEALKEQIDLIEYRPQTASNWLDGELKNKDWTRHFYSEYKFKNTTWYGFFEQYIVPEIEDRMRLDSPVSQIDYSGEKVTITFGNQNEVVEADRVIVTVPVTIMQSGSITFVPALPNAKTEAYDKVEMGDGMKVFIEFKERFYPDLFFFGRLRDLEDNLIYYDAAFGKESSRNILGLFTVSDPASEYVKLGSDEAIIEKILGELDEAFDGQASEHYLKHEIQNWSKEPYIQGSYSWSYDGSRNQIMEEMARPVENKLFFAGEALSDANQ